jgi:hypothetical protein
MCLLKGAVVIGKRWDHPGKKEISLCIKGITPTLRIVVDPDVDGSALAATLTRRLKECVASCIRESVKELLEYQDNGLNFECTREEVLFSTSEYLAQHKANVQQLQELFSCAMFDAEIDNNPDNGKHGMWLVSGMRHSCVVNGVGTARDALDKAITSGEVGSWECEMVKYLDPNGPEVFPV